MTTLFITYKTSFNLQNCQQRAWHWFHKVLICSEVPGSKHSPTGHAIPAHYEAVAWQYEFGFLVGIINALLDRC